MESRLICLDTSIFIDYFRKKNKEGTLLFQLADQRKAFSTTSITKFEVLRGATNAQQFFWETLFGRMDVLPFDDESANIAAEIFQKLKSQNKLIGIPDLLIASIAIQHKLPLATLNTREFQKVNELQLYSN
ncbi:MAG: type II toxin-antitoxin system VapC family toxin [Cyclobacteriaceae bacterium]|jgi:tRNA(fMet)-specific endonuclease VapC